MSITSFPYPQWYIFQAANSFQNLLAPQYCTRQRFRTTLRPNSYYQSPNLSFFSQNRATQPQKNFGDYLATTSMTLHMVANLLLFLSPWIASSAMRWAKPIQSLLTQTTLRPLSKRFLSILQDKKKLAEFIQSKGVSFAKLLQLNTGWQVGLYTQQPSKSISSIISVLAMTSNMFKYRQILDCTDNLASFLWFAGESNDIKNNVDPGHRREWDLKRLLHPLTKQPDGSTSAISSATKYITKDCTYAMSIKPWQEFYQAVRHYKRTNWKSPQAFQTAIGAQLNLFAFIGLLSSYGLTHYGKRLMLEKSAKTLSAFLTHSSKYFVVTSAIAYLPVLIRALPTWKEKENFMTVLGVPLSVTYQVLQASPIKLDTRKGLFVIGSPMVNEGKRLNSKRYRAQVDYLKFLYAQALKQPELRAQDVLSFLQYHPEEIQSMTLYMGKNRVDYILNKLKLARQQQQEQPVRLSQFLLPMMQEGAS